MVLCCLLLFEYITTFLSISYRISLIFMIPYVNHTHFRNRLRIIKFIPQVDHVSTVSDAARFLLFFGLPYEADTFVQTVCDLHNPSLIVSLLQSFFAYLISLRGERKNLTFINHVIFFLIKIQILTILFEKSISSYDIHRRYGPTSATTPMQPHIAAAFGCAPLMPPKPEETNTCIVTTHSI